MNKIIVKILAALAAVGAFFSAVFFVLMKQAKTEKKLEEAEVRAETAERIAESQTAARQAESAVTETKAELEKEDEKLNQRMHSGDSLDSFNAGIDMLRRQAERGDKRNSRTGSNGT